MQRLLTSMVSNPKTRKQLDAYGLEGVILHLLAADAAYKALGKRGTVCPAARLNRCAAACLVNQGRGRMRSVYQSRLRKTRLFIEDRAAFLAQLRSELRSLERRAERKGRRAVARLDGTSDLGLAFQLAPEFPGVQFYDYTKVYRRLLRARPVNHHLTFSLGAGNADQARAALGLGFNVTAVFRARKSDELPTFLGDAGLDGWESYRDVPVIDGDAHDFRFLDPAGVIVGLRSKGSAFHDVGGFVQ
ncbi:MAG: GP88 family protein [Tepidisphaeraceae bacterium]